MVPVGGQQAAEDGLSGAVGVLVRGVNERAPGLGEQLELLRALTFRGARPSVTSSLPVATPPKHAQLTRPPRHEGRQQGRGEAAAPFGLIDLLSCTSSGQRR
jgi:hypothetical protein